MNIRVGGRGSSLTGSDVTFLKGLACELRAWTVVIVVLKWNFLLTFPFPPYFPIFSKSSVLPLHQGAIRFVLSSDFAKRLHLCVEMKRSLRNESVMFHFLAVLYALHNR